MENLFLTKAIVKRDVETVYEALFLRSVTSFEAFLEELFIAILQGSAQYPQNRVSIRMTTKSTDALMEILLQGDKYLDWLPFNKTESRAKLYLAHGRPFSELDDAAKSKIKTIMYIRNAIAHKGHAVKVFQEKVIGSQPLLPGEKKPAGFLRAPTNAGTVRFEIYIGEMAQIASILC